MEQSVRHIKRVYFSVLGLNWFSAALPLPIFVLLMQARGIDLFQLGVIMGLYSATIILLELPTGGLADAIGRKRVALLAHTLNILSGVVLLLSFSFWGFLVGMILMGIGRALNSGALDAWYVDSLQAADPDIDLQPALAQAGTVTLLALGAGTLIGGLLPSLFSGLPADGTAVITPLSTTLLASGVLKILLVAVIAWTVQEPPRSPLAQADWRAELASVPQIVSEAITLTRQSRSLPLLMGITMIGGFTLAGVETFWQPGFAALLGDATKQSWLFGLVMAISFLAGMGGNLFSIPLSKRLNQRYTFVAGLAAGLQSMTLLVMALAQQVVGFAIGFWGYYLGNGLNSSPHETLVNVEMPAERRSAMLSVQSLASYVGGLAGSILLGAISEFRSVAVAWVLAAIISMVSLLLYARVARQQPRVERTHDESISVLDGS
jgi:MFS family permease